MIKIKDGACHIHVEDEVELCAELACVITCVRRILKNEGFTREEAEMMIEAALAVSKRQGNIKEEAGGGNRNAGKIWRRS